MNIETTHESIPIVSENLLHHFFNLPFIGMAIISPRNLRFLVVNDRLCEITGYSRDELTSKDVPELAHSEDESIERTAVQAAFERVVSGELESYTSESHFICKDRAIVYLAINSKCVRDHEGSAQFILSTVQDITERKRSEEKIQQYITQLNSALMHTVGVATTLSEIRDPYTAGHERRVAKIAVAIGAELGLEPMRLEGLRVAGSLHDVGKIAVPTEILAKPGKLNYAEFALIKFHPTVGYEALKDIDFPWPVAQAALQHHERMDGKGYPQGLKGEEILFEARILAVADVVESMASHRPYRPALGIEKALAEIERGRGESFDPQAVDACLRLFRERGFNIPD